MRASLVTTLRNMPGQFILGTVVAHLLGLSVSRTLSCQV